MNLKSNSQLTFHENSDRNEDYNTYKLKISELERNIDKLTQDVTEKSDLLLQKDREINEINQKLLKIREKYDIKKNKLKDKKSKIQDLENKLQQLQSCNKKALEFQSYDQPFSLQDPLFINIDTHIEPEDFRNVDMALNNTKESNNSNCNIIPRSSTPISHGVVIRNRSNSVDSTETKNYRPKNSIADKNFSQSPSPDFDSRGNILHSRSNTDNSMEDKLKNPNLDRNLCSPVDHSASTSKPRKNTDGHMKTKRKRELFDESDELDGTTAHQVSTNEQTASKKKATILSKLKACGYDTDDHLKSPNYNPKLERFSKYEKSCGKSMFHIAYGVSITYDDWKMCKKQINPSMFVRTLSEILWGGKLAYRAFTVERVCSSKLNISKVKKFTPKKTAVLQKAYHHYLKYKGYLNPEKLADMKLSEKLKLLQLWRTYLTSKINTARSAKGGQKQKLKETANDNEDQAEDPYDSDYLDLNII